MIEAVREQVPQENIDKLESIVDEIDLLNFPFDFRIFLMGKVKPVVIPRAGTGAMFH